MDPSRKEGIGRALGSIPSGLFVLSAGFEERRGGMICSWVQQTCFSPPMVSVAVAKGRSIMPLISESRQFALCQLGEDDKVILRKFAKETEPGDDPFLGFELEPSVLPGLPVLKTSMAFMECELMSHLDVDGDHDLFVGIVRNGGRRKDNPRVHVRKSGFNY